MLAVSSVGMGGDVMGLVGAVLVFGPDGRLLQGTAPLYTRPRTCRIVVAVHSVDPPK